MSAQAQVAFHAHGVSNARSTRNIANTALTAAVRFWCFVVLVGQLVFAFTVASLYGMAMLRGTTAQAWSRHITHGYVPGDTWGNFAVATHLFSAVLVILAGMLQLVPQIRERAPSLHRWNGRLYIVTAFAVSLAGLYMTWVRGSVGDLPQHIGSTLMAVLIMIFAVMALRYALARDFKTHRRWALRLYLVVSASLFIRAGLFLSFVLNRGPFGFDLDTFTGPFLTFIAFAQYLIPLAVLEIYLRVRERAGAPGRWAMASGLVVLTFALGAGIFAVALATWVPSIKRAYDSRKPMVEILSATIDSSGIDEAVKQYHDFKTSAPAIYNFDEGELNTLGYRLIRSKKFEQAIRIFQLNVEAYPQSSNVYDSLAEAYMNHGDKPLALANYQRALQLNPKNKTAARMIQELRKGALQ